jgi:RND family efflux transporter MFP subunit
MKIGNSFLFLKADSRLRGNDNNEGVMNILRFSSLLFTIAVVLCFQGCQSRQAAPTPPVANVEVTGVVQRDVPVYREWVTTLDGYVNAHIQPQVSGYLVGQIYKEGALVHKNDVLFEIDPRPFQVALQKAQGELAQTQAQLGKAKLDVKRDTPLAEEKAIAQSQLDNDIQAELSARASVESAQADVAQAQLNLDFTEVKSIIDGIAGIAKGQIGDLVGPATLLTTVSQVDPIKAYVSMSEQEYFSFTKKIDDAASDDQDSNHEDSKLTLILGNGETYPEKGTFIFADRQIDTGTGTILVAVSFPNPGNILRPGQFGRVRAVMSVKKGTILVPQRAVMELQGSYQVAVVGSDNKVAIRTVKVGETVDSMWIISEGLQPDERVVTEGVQNVRDGSLVDIK